MIVIKNMEIPSSCYECRFAKNKKTNDYGSFCECGVLEDHETINLLEHSKHPNCPLVEQEPTEKCTWIKYDYRTRCPKEHDVDSPYWRIPENRMETLKYCPYCGKEIEVGE